MTNFRIVTCDSCLTHLLLLELPVRCVKFNQSGVEILRSGNRETLAPDLQRNRLVQNGWFFCEYFDLEKAKPKKIMRAVFSTIFEIF